MTSPQSDEGRPRQEDGPSIKVDMPTLARALEHRDHRAYYTRAELEREFGQPYTVLRELHARWLDRLWP